ncbi:hypothetical protein BMS3Bbin12_00993 [bacterium BMS3Bbin12]|nr:hypothetical protein BMS3Abin12_01459 [bacterium BMS3Abin12]GBE47826.1 hypothetical protein BMS3Bbin12_00993 [bacterium BMS3Bbin12]GBE51073.1 hypothetical protein BMS3Bbin13_02026 [bacterium BMS3Bbin13]
MRSVYRRSAAWLVIVGYTVGYAARGGAVEAASLLLVMAGLAGTVLL